MRANRRANGRASGPVFQSVFLAVIDHSAFPFVILICYLIVTTLSHLSGARLRACGLCACHTESSQSENIKNGKSDGSMLQHPWRIEMVSDMDYTVTLCDVA